MQLGFRVPKMICDDLFVQNHVYCPKVLHRIQRMFLSKNCPTKLGPGLSDHTEAQSGTTTPATMSSGTPAGNLLSTSWLAVVGFGRWMQARDGKGFCGYTNWFLVDSSLGLIYDPGIGHRPSSRASYLPTLPPVSRGSLVIHSHCLVQCVTQNWSNKMPFNGPRTIFFWLVVGANQHFWTELRAPTLFNVQFRFLTDRLISHSCVRRNQRTHLEVGSLRTSGLCLCTSAWHWKLHLTRTLKTVFSSINYQPAPGWFDYYWSH